jgi:hypothetical protein
LPAQMAKYAAVPQGDRLRQGEILAGVVQVCQSLATIGEPEIQVEEITYPYVIVLTQDCDLEQDAQLRQKANQDSGDWADTGGRQKLKSVLLCEAFPVADLKSMLPPGKDIWKRVIQNKDERYQCIESVPPDLDAANLGIPSLGCDFRRFFTVPADELYRRLDLKRMPRRSRLLTPYAEHLQHRFCSFQARIPLPENHEVL